MSTGLDPTITLTKEAGWWIAEDTETGVVSQGRTDQAALSNLKEAVRGYHGEGEEPTEGDLRDAGIDPANNRDSGEDTSGIFE